MNKKMLDGQHLANSFDQSLAPYAQKNASSRGRKFPEDPDPERLPFQRDRDRIIHSKSFRRLKGKTQVVSPNLGDHFRNRLTHTLEVAQIARDLARQLRLNEDLAEAIALAHDLGHPPFGHAGEMALDAKMKTFGQSFDHNEQSLRIVEFFEQRYQDFPGLNLSIETLEGIQKHETFFDRPGGKTIFSPHLESQLVDISDEIAYLSADLEDALRGGFIELNDLKKIEIPAQAIDALEAEEQPFRSAIVRRVIRHLLLRIVADTKSNITRFNIKTLTDVQTASQRMVLFAPNFYEQFRALKNFLFKNYYLLPDVKQFTDQGRRIISKLFDYLHDHPEAISAQQVVEEANLERRICDYIAGMTDHFIQEKSDLYKLDGAKK